MMQTRSRKRLQLVMIGSLFAMPLIVAAILAVTGWVPGARSFGEGIVPQRSVSNVQIDLSDGSRLDWQDPDWRWSIVAVPGRTCAKVCMSQLDLMHRARISLNQNSRRVRLLYLGTPPTGTDADELMKAWQVGADVNRGFADWQPDVDDGVAAVLVKPDGVALTFYPDGFNASGLRKDLAKVTK
jgi:cytochrome oxidase Cu insertion factor (SCO1/SenC/PrrC family)